MTNPRLEDLISQMKTCDQFVGMTIYEHGDSVAKRYFELHNYITGKTSELTSFWRIPTWLKEPCLANDLLPLDIMLTYQLYHDIGKPQCKVIDENGVAHFPDHAKVSKRVWLEAHVDMTHCKACGRELPEIENPRWLHDRFCKNMYCSYGAEDDDNDIVGELIGMDMLAHTVKGDDLLKFAKHPYAPDLLFTALAEIHSNAEHLGRLDSDGFKIKAKQLDKVAKAIIKERSK
jgi:hypothetical protein